MSDIDDTIIAVSSPAGPGAEAVLRLSGEGSLDIAAKLFASCEKNPAADTYYVIEGTVSPDAAEVRVPAAMYVMRAPATYTRQDVVEFHLRASQPLLEALIDAAVRLGARPAGPGEFTRRAFLNGRIDLNQAEAVLDVITAAHRSDFRQALMQLKGFATERIESLRRRLLDVASLLELSIDFSDQDIEVAPPAEVQKRLVAVQHEIDEILRRGKNLVAREGVAVVLCGPANAGKSTLFNALARKEHAIVSPVPGTTRDWLEALIDVEGFRFRLIDTAGIKEAEDEVEAAAIARTREHAETASIRMLVLDGVECAAGQEEYFAGVAKIFAAAPQIVVLNKMDAVTAAAEERAALSSGARAVFPQGAVIPASAINREGLDSLEGELVRLVTRGEAEQAEFMPNLRQRHALERAAAFTARALESHAKGAGDEIVAFELRQAAEALAGVTGRIAPDEVLNEIFDRFCIGK